MAQDGTSKGFWTTLPGVLTAIAAILTAVAGLTVVLRPSPPTISPGEIPKGSPSVSSEKQPNAVQSPDFAKPPAAASRVVPPPKAMMGPLEEGKAYLGADLYSQAANSADECAVICRNDDRCKAMTFIKSQRKCWIKDSAQDSTSNGDMISAKKMIR